MIPAAEAEARDYARDTRRRAGRRGAGIHLSYTGQLGHGDETFSLMRASDLPPSEYVAQYFDTDQSAHGGSGST